MSTKAQLYMLIPLPPDQAAPASIPQGAIIVQLAIPLQQPATQAPLTVIQASTETSQAPRMVAFAEPQPGDTRTEMDPIITTQAGTLLPQSHQEQPAQSYTGPVTSVYVQPALITAPPMQNIPAPAMNNSAAGAHAHDQSVFPPEFGLLNPPIPEPAPLPGPGVRTLQMRLESFVEMGVLLVIWILSIVSLSIPSTLIRSEMYPADAVAQALGIPSIILVFLIFIRIALLQCFRKTFFRGKIVKIALKVAAALWTVGTAIHIIIAVLFSVLTGQALVNAGLGLAIAIVPMHVFSAILGANAVDRLI